MEHVKLFCKFEDKELVKQCGAKFDGESKCWFIDLKYIKTDNFNKLIRLINERKHAENKIYFLDIGTDSVIKRFNRFRSQFIKDKKYELIKDCYLNSDSDF